MYLDHCMCIILCHLVSLKCIEICRLYGQHLLAPLYNKIRFRASIRLLVDKLRLQYLCLQYLALASNVQLMLACNLILCQLVLQLLSVLQFLYAISVTRCIF